MADAISPPRGDIRAQRFSWFTALMAQRDRLLRDPRFQRWASTFPLTRPIARRQARAAFDLCAGFVYSQILAACLELDILDRLAAKAQSTAELAEQCALPPQNMEKLLAAAAALDLVARRSHGTWGLGMTGAAISGLPGLADMVRHHALLYADLSDPVALLRAAPGNTKLARFWPYAASRNAAALAPETTTPYTQLMARSQAMISRDIIEAYPLGRHHKLLDVGGGEGAFIGAAAQAATKLHFTLFDLPAVVSRARARLEAEGIGDRVTIVGGDFTVDPLPGGADLVSLVRVLHDHDDDAALYLLRGVRRALSANGRLLIAEPMAGTRGAKAMGDAYFGFYLLAMGQGKPRSAEAIIDMLKAAGFKRPRLLDTARPMLVRIIIADT